ncbi:hypothetical protein [Rhodococcus sp. NPDC003348]
MALGFIADETTDETGGGGSSLTTIIDLLNWIASMTQAGGVTAPQIPV